MKRLTSICLITNDVHRLRDFYTRLLDVTPEGDDTFATFSTGGISLSISSTEIMEKMAPSLTFDTHAGNCFLEFEVEDVDQEYARVQPLNVEIIKPPTTQPWGLRSVWFRDPQGNKINFFAHVKTD